MLTSSATTSTTPHAVLRHYQLYLNGFSRFWIFSCCGGLCLALSAALGIIWWGGPNRRLRAEYQDGQG
ncbi:hypothetical protein AK812_SmicGene22962 [Symbiodinium microadriaticum]|uniref:Uncharacterized protein n=1 Tax=Symbiodinium microadriaticum TaxID=2951 RepID=A0A1Q9DIG8_SYMMI|nr:hypothetical protein AK812_SmicGene22962 [Symbiodinium microadriaticum]